MRGNVYSMIMSFLLAGSLCACSHSAAVTANGSAQVFNQSVTPVTYQLANNYFIKNNVTGLVPRHIRSSAEFTRYFGMAETMGKNGKPTPIDFAFQDVIVYDAGIVQKQLEITPLTLNHAQDKLILDVRIRSGARQSYQMHPFILLIVPKNLPDKVEFKLKQP
ncbi:MULTISPECIES: hypothetical protein [unclassified Snodgrassella]|uniref:hypothetical protein n=1 Tax=unclassified Snodgrassella TaxID=2625236 RepID=UPI0018DB8EE3|nr:MULTISPECIES: hypothetical protein [unclassified Snodgrassella]MBI0067839.1 hypothetical protein [Snodgrassella sp. M0110]MBI0076838.1 hypothetical protein [Snodgrassella sp. M0118]MBI0079139.1 hypothetical protein [Snodgrassella sp. M0112]